LVIESLDERCPVHAGHLLRQSGVTVTVWLLAVVSARGHPLHARLQYSRCIFQRGVAATALSTAVKGVCADPDDALLRSRHQSAYWPSDHSDATIGAALYAILRLLCRRASRHTKRRDLIHVGAVHPPTKSRRKGGDTRRQLIRE